MRSSGRRIIQLIAGILGGVSCKEHTDAIASVAVARVREAPSCGDSLRPATAAPAEGLWVYEKASSGRIAAMIGPSRSKPGEARVTRRVETIETGADWKTIRFAVDTAVVRLELLPAVPDSLGRVLIDPRSPSDPAAVYAVSPRIVVASYEPCAATGAGPRLRYLRRDAAGYPVVDVMLRRVSGGD